MKKNRETRPWIRTKFSSGAMRPSIDAAESEDFCLAPSDLAAETAELVALTRDPICTRVVCRQQASDGDGAYRLNRDRFTPWALMP